MTFGEAISECKAGCRISRMSWIRGQYIELATNIIYVNSTGKVVKVNHDFIGDKALAAVGPNGVQLGWLPTHADVLADDWHSYKP